MENDEKKTLRYLNSKAWYRLLKVVFILSILLVLIFTNWIIFDDGFKEIDNHKTVISCTYGDKETFTPEEIGIKLSNYDFPNRFEYQNFFEGQNNYAIKNILKNCYPDRIKSTHVDIFVAQKIAEVWGDDRLSKKRDERPPLTKDEENYLENVIPEMANSYDKEKYLDYGVKVFDIKPAYSYKKFIAYFIIGNFLILAFVELLRRTFYYVILGTFRPKKKISTF